jgi:hypothetical protein
MDMDEAALKFFATMRLFFNLQSRPLPLGYEGEVYYGKGKTAAPSTVGGRAGMAGYATYRYII